MRAFPIVSQNPSITCNNLADDFPIGASLIVSIGKNAISVPWSVNHQNLEFRQMVKKPERIWRVLNCVIELHPVVVFKLKSVIAVLDKEIPSVLVETVQPDVLKAMLIQPQEASARANRKALRNRQSSGPAVHSRSLSCSHNVCRLRT